MQLDVARDILHHPERHSYRRCYKAIQVMREDGGELDKMIASSAESVLAYHQMEDDSDSDPRWTQITAIGILVALPTFYLVMAWLFL